MSLAVLPATAVIMSFIKKDYSANASFYSILVPMVLLFVLYPRL
jgi:thiamine transporter ThiT